MFALLLARLLPAPLTYERRSGRSKRRGPGRFVALLLLGLIGCLATACVEVRPHGVVEGPRGADRVVFHLVGVEGFRNGYHALELPADWAERPMILDGAGGVLLDPIELEWVPITRSQAGPEGFYGWSSGALSRIQRRAPGGDSWSEPLVFGDLGQPLSLTGPQSSVGEFDEGRLQAVSERLLAGESTYRLNELDTNAHAAYRLLGAVGPPVRWVHLGDFEFRDGRSGFSKTTERALAGPAQVLEVAIMSFAHWGWLVLVFAA